MLNDVQLEVCEAWHGEVVVGQDPQGAAHVVCNLAVLNAFLLQHFVENGHATSLDEFEGELVFLEHKHKAVRKCLS